MLLQCVAKNMAASLPAGCAGLRRGTRSKGKRRSGSMYIKAGALGGVAVAALLAMPAASLLTTRRSTMSFATLPVPASRKTRALGGR
jgi:hypothetical protein